MRALKVVVAPDSFKECLAADEVAAALAAGVRAAAPQAEVLCVPLADGGEGTVRALVAATEGTRQRTRVTGPLGEPVDAEWGLLGNGTTAVVEMAAASGLPLVPPERRDPMRTTTRGTGELIAAALDRGARRILLGIGGSATVDGGGGMAQALGARLLDREGRDIGPGGGELARLHTVDLADLDPRLTQATVDVACDVENPLLGPTGAATVYAPQKGATPEMVRGLEAGLARLAEVVERDLGVAVRDVPGAGAAGGLGAGLVAFLGARLRPGVELVMAAVGLAEKLRDAHLVLVAEGQVDRQTAYGKGPAGVGRLAAGRGIPVVALAGRVGEGAAAVHEAGIVACWSVADGPMEQAEAFARAPELLARAAEQVVRFFVRSREEKHAGGRTPA